MHHQAALVVFLQHPIAMLSSDHTIPMQQCFEDLPLIPRRIHFVQQPIQVMPQFLSENRIHLIWACRRQPVSIQIDGACGDGISPKRPADISRRQQHNRRQSAEITFRPLGYKLLKSLRRPVKEQGLLSCRHQRAICCPALEQHIPLGE